jgi:hypothetical protein
MKNYITLFFFALLIGISCSKENTIEDDLVGEWVYERETFISGSTFEDLDTRGVMTFNKDETGTWVSDNGFNFSNEIEWDLQRMDSKISITKIPPPEFSNFSISQIYELKQNGDNEFVFTFEFYLSSLDSVPTLQRFENIILTRK